MLYSAPLPKFRRDLPLLSLAGFPPLVGAALWLRLYPHRYRWGLGLVSFVLGMVQGNLVIAAGIGLVIYGQLSSQVGPSTRPLGRLGLGLAGAVNAYVLLALWQSTHSPLISLVVISQVLVLWLILDGFQTPNWADGAVAEILRPPHCSSHGSPQLISLEPPTVPALQPPTRSVLPLSASASRVMAAKPVEYVEYQDI